MAFRFESEKMWKEKKQGEKTKVGKKMREIEKGNEWRRRKEKER